MVLQTNDPTAHAEVTAIRKACARMGTFDLSDCVLYTSCYPCPMCYGAIHWAKVSPVAQTPQHTEVSVLQIKRCVFAASPEDAAQAGFDDAFIYESIRGTASEEHCEFIKEPHQALGRDGLCFMHLRSSCLQGAISVFKKDYEMY